MSLESANPLGEFLRASRARITPEAAGVQYFADNRRVSGLRREELALLAGVSSSYYTRVEQGHSRGASPQVLDALASALRLDDIERAHLHRLGRVETRKRRPQRPAAEQPDAALVELLAALGDVPALIIGRHNDLLAWNSMGHALLAGHLAFDAPADPRTRPNLTKLIFFDDATRALYLDWRAKAAAAVGNLRLAAAQNPDDAGYAELVGALCMGSVEFAEIWADQRVQACATAVYELDHPLVGEVTITQQTLRSASTPTQSLITNTAATGSASADALALLARLVSEDRGSRDRSVDASYTLEP